MTGEQIIEQWAAHPNHPITISTAERASVVEGWHENDRLYGQVLADCEERDDKIQQLQTKVDFLEQQLAGLQAHHESDHVKHKEEITELRRTLDRNNKEAAKGMYLLKEEREKLRGEIERLNDKNKILESLRDVNRDKFEAAKEIAENRQKEIERLRAALEKPPVGCHTYVMTYDAQGKVIGADIGCSHWQQASNEVQNEYHSLIDDYAEVKSKLMDYEATFPLRQWLWVKRLFGQGQEGGEG